MVIPIGDRNPTRRRPWVTWLLVAINLGVFLLLTPWWGGPCEQLAFYLRWAVVSAEVTQGAPLDPGQIAAGSPVRCALEPFTDKNVYAPVLYAMFLHGGWGHLLFNMLYLWIFGNNVEDRMGHLRFTAFYLFTGALATLAFVVANPGSPQSLVGASGAIAGVLGAYLVLFPHAQITVLVPIFLFFVTRLPALLVLGLWFVLQLQQLRVAPLAGGGVAYLAHIAGFIAGVVLTLLLGYRHRRRPAHRAARWR